MIPYANEGVTEIGGRLHVTKTCPTCGEVLTASTAKAAGLLYSGHHDTQHSEPLAWLSYPCTQAAGCPCHDAGPAGEQSRADYDAAWRAWSDA